MITDDEWADRLRGYARATYPAGDGPDPALVVRAGRRRKIARRATTATTACVVVAALVLGTPPLVDRDDHRGAVPAATSAPATGSSLVAQQPRSFGTGQVATLGDLAAVNVPDTSSATTYTAQNVAGLRVTVGRVGSTAVLLTVTAGGATSAHLAWQPHDMPANYSAAVPYPMWGPAFFRNGQQTQFAYLAGMVPSWLHNPRALLVAATGWALPDGTTTHLAEIPTFRAPTPDGRLMFVAAATGDAATGLLTDPGAFVVFVGDPDQQPFAPACGSQTADECGRAAGLPADWLTETPAQFSPTTSPQPSAAASTPALSSASSAPTAAVYPGRVTNVGTAVGANPDPVGAGVINKPQQLDLQQGYAAALGVGGEIVVIDSPMPASWDESSPTYASGIGIRSAGGSVHWLVAPPGTPTVGPAIGSVAASAGWVVWLQSATTNQYDGASTLWAVPRAGSGPPREIDAKVDPPVAAVLGMQATSPIILGDWVLWYDSSSDAYDVPTFTPPPGSPVVLAARLDGSAPPRVLVADASGFAADLCAGDLPAFYVTTGAQAGPPALHRMVLAGDGSIASDEVVRADLTGTAQDTWDASACGDTVAIAHHIDEEDTDPGSWVEIDHGGDVQSIVIPHGTGSSVSGLTVGPRLVTWVMYNGSLDGWAFAFDLADDVLYRLSDASNSGGFLANASILSWLEISTSPEGKSSFVTVVAPIRAP